MAVNVGHLGRRKGISRSGLSTVLDELKKKKIPDATSRQTIKRRRDADIDVQTRYGKLLQDWKVTLLPVGKKKKKSGSVTKPKQVKTVEFPFVQPIPLLCHMCLECPEFSAMMLKVLDRYAPSQSSPLSLICYSDGISPGNVLAHNQTRKVECVYWSIKEFGDLALSLEKNWFLLGIARTDHVKRMAGKMSQYFRHAVERFFSPVDLRHGVQLAFPNGERRMLFCDLSIVIGDEVALKESLDMKGASGTVLCPLCRNLVDWKSNLDHHSTEFVPSNSTTLAGVDLHSDETLLETVQFLASRSNDVSKTAFKKMEQALGFNHNRHGLLQSNILTLKPVSFLMYDWMHTYAVGGLWNVELGSLVAKLSAHGVTQERLNDELNRFTWPSFLAGRGVTGVNIFSKEDQDGDIKCSASECLSVYSVIRFILSEFRKNGELEALKQECDSYFRLCRVLDLLVHQKKHGWDPDALRQAIERHLKGYVALYERFLPKHHYSLHLPSQCAQHETLVSCWVHERKHKEIKRHANLITNTWSNFERSVIVDAMGDSLDALAGTPDEPYYGGLCSPAEAGSAISQEFRKLGFDEQIFVSRTAFFSPGAKASAGDVVRLVDDVGEQCLGEVNFFATTTGQNFCCITHWKAKGNNKFQKSGTSFVAELSQVMDVCIYRDGATSSPSVVSSTTW